MTLKRGRQALLPSGGEATEHGLLSDGLTVRCYEEGSSLSKDFLFSRLPVSPELQRLLADAFAKRTAPGRGLRSIASIELIFRVLRIFSEYLAQLPQPPRLKVELEPRHIDGYKEHREKSNAKPKLDEEMRAIKSVLRQCNWTPDMVAKLAEPNPRRVRKGGFRPSYTRGEFQRIAAAARKDLSAAAERIRANRKLLSEYRDGKIEDDTSRRLELLDYVERHADVPRDPELSCYPHCAAAWVASGGFGSVREIVRWLHLSPTEVAAASVLFAVMTGQNPYVIMKCTADHHRADGYAGGTETAIVGLRKPRRRRRAFMDLALSAVPDWITVPEGISSLSARDELHTPFGLFALMYELTESSRRIEGSGRLMVAYCGTGRPGRAVRPQGAAQGWVQPWSAGAGLLADGLPGEARGVLEVSLVRLRKTYLELNQKPVAHTEQTLINDYLGRGEGNLDEYRKVVAEALAEEVSKARARPAIATLDAQGLAQLSRDPAGVAANLGISEATLRRLASGQLDTVMAGCVDNMNGPDGKGGACKASFVVCLGCPCARALPRHLPVQLLVREHMEMRRAAMTPLAWAKRFALPYTQLVDLLERHDADSLTQARAEITDAHREMVDRFFKRELDFR